MHSVHDTAVTRKNDRKSEIAFEHQACMVDNFAGGEGLVPSLDQ
jgi:hypothetical protein